VRVLRWFARSGLIESNDVREMLAWENSGFSLDAAVRVGAHDRAGLERLLRYCARPPFALERLERLDAERVVYRLPKPQRDGTTVLTLTPLELVDQLAARIPPQGITEEKRGQRQILRSAGWRLNGLQPSRTNPRSGTAPMAGWSPRRS